MQNARKDTGYSTGSSHTSYTQTPLSADEKQHYSVASSKTKHSHRSRDSSCEPAFKKSVEPDVDSLEMMIKREKQRRKKLEEDEISEESVTENELLEEKKRKKVKDLEKGIKIKKIDKKREKMLELSSTEASSE